MAHACGVFHQPFAFDNRQISQRHRTASGMARVGIGVHPALFDRRIHDHLADRVGDLNAAQRQIAAGDALGKGHNIRLNAPAVEAKPFAGAPKTGNHFVGNQ